MAFVNPDYESMNDNIVVVNTNDDVVEINFVPAIVRNVGGRVMNIGFVRDPDTELAKSALLYLRKRDVQIQAFSQQTLSSYNVAKPVACIIYEYLQSHSAPILTGPGSVYGNEVCIDLVY